MPEENKFFITIFTPTYNRAYALKNSYEAMKRQTQSNFIWLIVDDGSTDNTKEVVEEWQKEAHSFRIDYVYKENGGLQSGYFEALKHVETELCGCIDSDGYLVDDAIESIQNIWNSPRDNKIAGVMGLDAYVGGDVIGGLLPEDMKRINLIDLDIRQHRKSDRVFFIKTEIYKSVQPPKRYPGEKTMNESYLLFSVAKEYDFLVLNKPICMAIYDENGLTAQGWRRYFMKPNTYVDWRLFLLTFDHTPLSFKIRNTLHYIAECRIARRKVFRDTPHKVMTLLLYPAGILYYLLLRFKYGRWKILNNRISQAVKQDGVRTTTLQERS